jgi:hypothetical protein
METVQGTPEERAPNVGDTLDARPSEGTPEAPGAAPFAEVVRAGTRLLLGSAGLAIASVSWWQRGREAAIAPRGASGAEDLAAAALGLGLTAQRVLVKGAAVATSTAASVTWGVVHATPFRRPVEHLAEQFRAERRISEQEVSEGIAAIADTISEAILARVDIDKVIDRIALERVLTRIDRRELEQILSS